MADSEAESRMTPRSRLAQIDLIKGAAILSVIALHGLAARYLRDSWAVFHVGQAVPVFFVVMGMNAVLSSWAVRGEPLRKLYSRAYLAGRVERLLVPFAVIWIASVIAGVLHGGMHFGPALATGALPLSGPGNYFVPIAIEFALLFPLLWWCFDRRPVATVVACFCLDAGFELLARHIHFPADPAPYLYDTAIFRYLAQIALGLWIGAQLRGDRSRAGWIAALAPISAAYLAVLHERSATFTSWLRFGFGISTNFLSSFWAATLVLAGLRFLPRTETAAPARFVGALGRASWHIFLVQILWFNLVRDRSLTALPMHFAANCAIGYLFHRVMTHPPVAARVRAAIMRLFVRPRAPQPVPSGRQLG
jgi:peptidoglycan/LPS O-acetylase OafA/YrhL